MVIVVIYLISCWNIKRFRLLRPLHTRLNSSCIIYSASSLLSIHTTSSRVDQTQIDGGKRIKSCSRKGRRESVWEKGGEGWKSWGKDEVREQDMALRKEEIKDSPIIRHKHRMGFWVHLWMAFKSSPWSVNENIILPKYMQKYRRCSVTFCLFMSNFSM